MNELTSEFSILIIDNDTIQTFYNNLENNNHLDIIIIQRDIFDKLKLNLKEIEILFNKLYEKNIKIIFDIDDDLLNIDKTHVSYDRFSKIEKTLKIILKNSDIVTVSTENLKTQLVNLNENTTIVPNTLLKLFDFNPNTKIKNLNNKKTIKIGYFGTRTHGNDVKLIENAIYNVKKVFNNKNIILEVVGVCSENHEWIKKINMPNNYKNNPTYKDYLKNFVSNFLSRHNLMYNSLPYINFINWMQNEMDWDIAVAPLEDTNINRSKSNLKYLEYTALNIPGVYSNIGPYKEIGEKNTGIVVNNTPEEWEKALINLIEDNELYETILKNAHEDVEKNYLVKNSSTIWKDILDEF